MRAGNEERDHGNDDDFESRGRRCLAVARCRGKNKREEVECGGVAGFMACTNRLSESGACDRRGGLFVGTKSAVLVEDASASDSSGWGGGV